MEEELFDDMVWQLFRDDLKGMDANDMDQECLYKASSISVIEGCTFSILCASFELLNLHRVYGWSNNSFRISRLCCLEAYFDFNLSVTGIVV